MKKRPVTIYRLDLISWEPPLAEIAVHCSSGAYIRSLARDLALAAGSRGYLAALTRTHVAGFELSRAVGGDDPNLPAALLPINRTVFEALGLPWFDLDKECVQYIIQGKPLSHILKGQQLRYPVSGPGDKNRMEAAGVFCGDLFAALIEKKPGTGGEPAWSYGYVYAAAGPAQTVYADH
jgi:tRNA pseudouridine55 synthase